MNTKTFNKKIIIAGILFWIGSTYIFDYMYSILNAPEILQNILTPSLISLMMWCIISIYFRSLWKTPIINKLFEWLLGLEVVPNISGQYSVKIKSNWNDYKVEYKGKLEIKQNYKDLSITGAIDISGFKSCTVFIERIESTNSAKTKEWKLFYDYKNIPHSTSIGKNSTGLASHHGLVHIIFTDKDKKVLTGFYGTDENRKTRGKIVLIKKKDKAPK